MSTESESLVVAGDSDASVRQVQVVQREVPDSRRTGRVDGGQGDHQPLRRGDRSLLDGVDLCLDHRKQVTVDVGLRGPLMPMVTWSSPTGRIPAGRRAQPLCGQWVAPPAEAGEVR